MDNVQECLDRALATTSWSEWFARSVVTHVPFSSSNHLPILVTLRQQQPQRRRQRLVQFEDKWTTHPKCEGVIRHAWALDVGRGSPMYILTERIKRCRIKLLEWSKQLFRNVQTQVQARWASLEALLHDNSNDQHIRELKDKINSFLLFDELHWRQ
ncbi:reverse transcriptase [Fagus crenata]